MTARSSKERSAKAAARRRERGEVILRLPTLEGTRQQLDELMQWHGIEEMAEAMTLMIRNVHAMGREDSAALLAVPRHEIAISPNVARRLRTEGERLAMREAADEA